MDTNETEKNLTGENIFAVENIFGCCLIFVIGIIFHILGLWLEIFVWVEKLCCFVLIYSPIALLYPYRELNKSEQLKLIGILIVCITMAFAIYANYEQVDKERTEERHKFEQECIQKVNKDYPCKYGYSACSIVKENYITMCKVSAIDWRDTQKTVAFNIKDKMAGTLAIGTAIVFDGIGATLSYPINLLLKGKDAKFGGYRLAQDLAIKAGLYKVPYENYENIVRDKGCSSFNLIMGSLCIGKYNIYTGNIFIAICIAVMCIAIICSVKEFLNIYIVYMCIFFGLFIKDFVSAIKEFMSLV